MYLCCMYMSSEHFVLEGHMHRYTSVHIYVCAHMYLYYIYMSRFNGLVLEGYMHRCTSVLVYVCVHMYL